MSHLRHVDPNRRRSRLTPLMAWLGTNRVANAISRVIGWKLDPVLLRLTRGRLCSTLVIPTAVLETRGARTGERRGNAVVYFHDGTDRVVIAASHAGAPHHPAWYHNLRANPDVVFGGTPMRAAVIDEPAELERLWPLADRVFPAYEAFRLRAAAAGRTIPLLALTPSSVARPGGA